MRQINLDVLNGDTLRDEGIEAVSREEWMRKGREAFVAYRKGKHGFPVLGSDVQQIIRDAGCPEPHHPNAYGALVRELIRDGLIKPTNTFLSASHAKAHSRAVRVYLVV